MYLFIYKLNTCNMVVTIMQINTDTHMEILEGWNFFKKFQCFPPVHHRIVWDMLWGVETHHVTWRWRLWLPWSEHGGNRTMLTPSRRPAALAVKAVVCRALTPGSLDRLPNSPWCCSRWLRFCSRPPLGFQWGNPKRRTPASRMCSFHWKRWRGSCGSS